ncbi:MAG TPA: RimK family alpha-L-glutamate ligase [Gemmatimonadota bacterium]|nr:RimK family alpha-L-glutamate ligase [Gemmatimonadota bacterium]
MNFLLLSRQRWLYSTRRFRDTARARGYQLSMVDPLECGLAIGPDGVRLFFRDRDVPSIDVAIPRIGASLPGQGVAVVSHLEAMGIPLVNSAAAIRRARDKLLALQILTARGIVVPRTVLARGPDQVEQALEMVGGPPVVLKLLQGTQGVGVILAETRAAAVSTLDTLWGLRQDVIVQEYVADSAGRDIRALVVGGRIVAAMRRQAPAGEWRSNIHRGGTGARVDLDPQYADAAVAAAAAIGLDVAGVDLLEARDGPRVTEVNASPGFEGLERVCRVDAASAILDLAEALATGLEPRSAPIRLASGTLLEETEFR